VELSLSAGLNFTTYDFEYELSDGSKNDVSDVTAPLPMYRLRMSYAFNPNWLVHYVAESFFIELVDNLRASLLN